MTKRQDLTGMTFQRLTVIQKGQSGYFPSGSTFTKWICKCECGNMVEVYDKGLKKGTSGSCGCLQKERASKAKKTHGMSETKVYMHWKAMHNRCYNPNTADYKNYGGRGIKVALTWFLFENFYMDMGEPEENQTLDRIDTNGNYEKDNCKWATRAEQNVHKQNTVWVVLHGERMASIEASRKLGLSYAAFNKYAERNNCSVQDAVDYYANR